MRKQITTRKEDYSQWYLDVIEAADLAENSAVRGCMIFKPNGYAIWEQFKEILDKKFKETGHRNAYFPLFIPKSFLSKEAKHVEGFAQESAVVTHYRLKTNSETREVEVDNEAKLEEELIVRPTSETIIYDSFSRWIESYRDLPLLINQWANVVRWEMRTRPFLRTAEFLWQEGHTAHATHDDAEEEALRMLEVYKEFAEEYLAMSVIPGEKSESERFAGALRTYTIEAMMQDGKALQAGTSHNLGDGFAKSFDIKFTDKDGALKHAWTTSWGLSTRMIGGMIMTHSDDKGLVLPPRIAPTKVVIIPIWKSGEEKSEVLRYSENLKKDLEKNLIHTELDTRDYLTPGAKFNEHEKKGTPIRIEIGPRDVASQKCILVRRDLDEKITVDMNNTVDEIKKQLENMHNSLLENSRKFREANTYEVNTYDELRDVVENKNGFALAHWDGTKETEARIKEETKATIRCIPFNSVEENGKCIYSSKKSTKRVIFAKAY